MEIIWIDLTQPGDPFKSFLQLVEEGEVRDIQRTRRILGAIVGLKDGGGHRQTREQPRGASSDV